MVPVVTSSTRVLFGVAVLGKSWKWKGVWNVVGTTSCEDGESNKMTYNGNPAECRQLCHASAKQIQCTIRDASSTTWQRDAVRRSVIHSYFGWSLPRCTRRWKHISQHRWWNLLTVRWYRLYAENVSRLTFMVGEKPGRTKDIVLFRRGTAFSLEEAYVGIRRWPETNLGDKMRRHPYSRRRSLGLNAAAIL